MLLMRVKYCFNIIVVSARTMATSHCIVVAIAVGIAIYMYSCTRNTAGLEKSCPADRCFNNNGSLKVDDLIYLDDGIAVCDEDRCYSTKYSTLETYYGTIFSKDNPYDHFGEVCRDSDTDGDRCCPTYVNLTSYTGEKQDVNGDTCKIIILPKRGRNNTTRKQHVVEGLCCPDSVCPLTGAECLQENVPHPLLARKKGDKIIAFHLFDVPAYCSCKNY